VDFTPLWLNRLLLKRTVPGLVANRGVPLARIQHTRHRSRVADRSRLARAERVARAAAAVVRELPAIGNDCAWRASCFGPAIGGSGTPRETHGHRPRLPVARRRRVVAPCVSAVVRALEVRLGAPEYAGLPVRWCVQRTGRQRATVTAVRSVARLPAAIRRLGTLRRCNLHGPPLPVARRERVVAVAVSAIVEAGKRRLGAPEGAGLVFTAVTDIKFYLTDRKTATCAAFGSLVGTYPLFSCRDQICETPRSIDACTHLPTAVTAHRLAEVAGAALAGCKRRRGSPNDLERNGSPQSYNSLRCAKARARSLRRRPIEGP
jgi:hypothetical protein